MCTYSFFFNCILKEKIWKKKLTHLSIWLSYISISTLLATSSQNYRFFVCVVFFSNASLFLVLHSALNVNLYYSYFKIKEYSTYNVLWIEQNHWCWPYDLVKSAQLLIYVVLETWRWFPWGYFQTVTWQKRKRSYQTAHSYNNLHILPLRASRDCLWIYRIRYSWLKFDEFC